MRILFPVEVFYPSQAGGPANTVYWLAKNLVKNGVEVTVVSSNKGISSNVVLDHWSEGLAGKVIYVKTIFLHFPLRQTLSAIRQLFRSEVVHLSSIFYPAAFLTAFAARVLGRKIVWSPRGELSGYSLNYSGKRKKPILWVINRLIGTSATFHSTSDEETADIRRCFGEKATVFQIPNFIEVEQVAKGSEGDYLLYLGRFHPKKAIDSLLLAAARSEAFLASDKVLRIAGKGKTDYESELRLLVLELGLEGKIEFVGHVEGEKKNSLLAGAYFTLMPSHTENFGIVVLESLAQCTPVVASIHTPWESLESEKVGFWTDNTPEGLAKTLDRILQMEASEYLAYRDRSRAFVLNRFDITQNFHEWMALYGSLTKSHSVDE